MEDKEYVESEENLIFLPPPPLQEICGACPSIGIFPLPELLSPAFE